MDNMNLKEVFESELKKHSLSWCKGECHSSSSHKRGFVAYSDKKTVHYDSQIATRKTLHGGLHEIGHCVNDESGLRRFKREALAEKFATDTMRQLGIVVPRNTVALGRSYVSRWKRFGDKIKASKS